MADEPVVVNLDEPEKTVSPPPVKQDAAPVVAPAPATPTDPAPAGGEGDVDLVKAAEAILAKEVADKAAVNPDAALETTQVPAQEAEQQPDSQYLKATSEAGQAAMNLMQAAGVSMEDAQAALAPAAKTGNAEDVNMDFLRTKMDANQATLVEAGIKAELNAAKARVTETTTAVHNSVGGKANWDAVSAWAKTADATTQAEIKDLMPLFQAGGKQAELAAQRMHHMFTTAGNTSTPTAEVDLTQGDTGATVQNGPLSRDDYLAQRKAVEANNKLSQPQRDALVNNLLTRRRAGRDGGI